MMASARSKDHRLLTAHTYLVSLGNTVKRGTPLQNFLHDLQHSPYFLRAVLLGTSASMEGKIGQSPFAAAINENQKAPNQDAVGIFSEARTIVITDGYQEEGYWCALVLQKIIADNPGCSPLRWVDEATKVMRNFGIGPFSGTCFISASLKPNRLSIAWLGDCKCFHIRGKSILFETEEHTIAGDAIREGRSSATALWNTHDHHVVSKSVHPLGDETPSTQTITVQQRDWIVLCSDGVSDNLKTLKRGVENYDRILAILQKSSTPGEARDQILREVQKHIALGIRGDTELADSKKDNVSLVVMRML
jgi:hypothetical protein